MWVTINVLREIKIIFKTWWEGGVKFQNAFVGGRQILNVALIANEVVDSRKEALRLVQFANWIQKRLMTIWIWNSLLSEVEKMGFGLKWRKWINFYIFTVRMSILVNGSPPKFFQISRGYRQVDPLSLSRVEQEGCIHGFKVRGQIRRRFSSLPPHIYRQYFYFS